LEAAKRIAKNTGILYARMAITVFISLYSTRLILAALGVADFGLFNVVGGVISMLGFLNSSMAGATQRFMSFAQGAGDLEKVKRIFNMSSLLHWGIAVLVFLLLEVAGYFFFDGILNIAPDRLEVAKLIYQFMVISTLFTVISVPYEAVITSHENMMVYAVMGVIEVVLKLGIAFYISYTGLDHLVMYGVLMAALSICLLIIKRIYCHRVYEECDIQVRQYFDKPLLMEMGGFAGWSLLGSSSNLISNYGQSIILNIFFGTVLNAAQGIAGQISGQLSVFSNTLIKVFNPLIDKSMGAGNRTQMLKFTMIGSKVSFFVLLFFYSPILIVMPYFFKFWLKSTPEYTIIFCRLIMVRNLIEQMFIPLVTALGAKGDIKAFQITSSILVLVPLLTSYILFKFEYTSEFLYLVYILYSLLASTIILFYSKKKLQLSINEFVNYVLLKCVICFFLIFIVSFLPIIFIKTSFLRLILVVCSSTFSFILIIYFIGFSKNEKIIITDSIKSILNKFRKNKVFI
jgi:O-antigen/teichoic acid export membrane protein